MLLDMVSNLVNRCERRNDMENILKGLCIGLVLVLVQGDKSDLRWWIGAISLSILVNI